MEEKTNTAIHPKLQLLSQIYESSVESNKTLDFDVLLKACFLNDLEEALLLLRYTQQVYFAYMCADSVKHLIENEKAFQASQKCMELISKWLKKPESVKFKQLNRAAYASFIAIHGNNTAYISIAASHAADAVYAAANVIYSDSDYIIVNVARTIFCAIKASNNEPKQSQLHLSFLIKAIHFKGL